MRNKFPSLTALKQFYPDLGAFYTQSWVYAGITAYYGQQNRFADLEFHDSVPDLIIHDYDGNVGVKPGSNYHGLVFEGHINNWVEQEVDKWGVATPKVPWGTVLISGKQHLTQTPKYTSLGFDYWDIIVYNEFRAALFYYEINQSSIQAAEYDVVIPVGSGEVIHRQTFLKVLNELKQDLTIVTDDRQTTLDTNLRFSSLGIEVYFNKVGLKEYKLHHTSPSFYDTNSQRSLDHLPHKKMHSIARVNVVLESTLFDTIDPYLTEKTYKVLAQHRPFIIFGDTNILKKLKTQGFLTFDKYCDESYDTISDLLQKSQCAVVALKQLVESCKKYPDEIDRICKHNQELFFNHQRHANNLATFGKNILDIVK